MRMVAAVVIKRESFTERVFFQNRLLPLSRRIVLNSFLRPSRFIFRTNQLYFCATLRTWRANNQIKLGHCRSLRNFRQKKMGMIKIATILTTLIIGLMAGPAVSL